MEFTEILAQGDRRASLEALRDMLAEKMLRASPTAAALISKQLADILEQLDGLPNPNRESALDDLASRRAARRQGTAG